MVGSVVHRFVAMDNDQGLNGAIEYSLEQLAPIRTEDDDFEILSFTGDLRITRALDINEVYELRITATVSRH